MSTTTSRLIFVLVGIAVGLAIGLLYGWILSPVEYVDTAPASLRADYRTDYTLMIAESFSADQDGDLARIRLAALGPEPPDQIVKHAIEFAVEHQFDPNDLVTLERLYSVMEQAGIKPEIGNP